jgi:hypothetical protein
MCTESGKPYALYIQLKFASTDRFLRQGTIELYFVILTLLQSLKFTPAAPQLGSF